MRRLASNTSRERIFQCVLAKLSATTEGKAFLHLGNAIRDNTDQLGTF